MQTMDQLTGNLAQQNLSVIASLNQHSFFNCLLQEYSRYQLEGELLYLPLTQCTWLVLHLAYVSPLGRHRYYEKIQLHRLSPKPDSQRIAVESISFLQAVSHVTEHLFTELSTAQQARFINQITQSSEYIELFEHATISPPKSTGFLAAEQQLMGGHNMHPAPKTHAPLTVEQQGLYLPESANTFALHWLLVDPQYIGSDCVVRENRDNDLLKSAKKEEISCADLLNDLFEQSLALEGKSIHSLELTQDWVAYPMHPLQYQAWRNSEPAKVSQDYIVDLNLKTSGWFATSSVRAIYHPQLPWMLKLSLPIQLTNSLRLLSEQEIYRGIDISQVLATPAGQELQQRLPQMMIMQEPAWCGLLTQPPSAAAQSLDPLSLLSVRENPFYQRPELAEQYHLLASCNQPLSRTAITHSAIAQWITQLAESKAISTKQAAQQWFSAFMQQVIYPICVARSDYGLVLLAHQQNILLKIEDNLPVGVGLRDCQGMGFTDRAFECFADYFAQRAQSPTFNSEFSHASPLYSMPASAVDPYLAYYLIGNSLISTIAHIGSTGMIDEQSLICLAQDRFRAWRAQSMQETGFYDYLLQSPQLRWKRNFYCFSHQLNEATLADPSDIYCEIENPFAQALITEQRVPSEPLVLHKTLGDRQLTLLTFKDCSEHVADLSQTGGRASKASAFTCLFSCIVREYGQVIAKASIQYFADQSCQFMLHDLVHEQDIAQEQASATKSLLWWSMAEHALMLPRHPDAGRLGVPSQWLGNPLKWLRGSPMDASKPEARLTLTQFLQTCPLWLSPRLEWQYPIQRIAENGFTHPQRAPKPSGIVYQRYDYELGKQVSFRVIDPQRDLACFHRWHNDENTSPIWELAGDLAMHQDYLAKQQADPHQYAVIGEFDGVPFGYFELYWTKEDRLAPYYAAQDYDRGVHILVGNLAYRGAKYFKAWGRLMLHYLFLDHPQTNNIMGEPRADNVHLVRITERIGLEKQGEFDFPHKRAALLQCRRQRFFKQFAV